jgi:hypothetical protein
MPVSNCDSQNSLSFISSRLSHKHFLVAHNPHRPAGPLKKEHPTYILPAGLLGKMTTTDFSNCILLLAATVLEQILC